MLNTAALNGTDLIIQCQQLIAVFIDLIHILSDLCIQVVLIGT